MTGRLRFIFGGSGAGKSTWLRRDIIGRSLSSPDTHFLIVVPDQFTMETQLDVVREHPRHATTNIDVVSFGRLTHRIFDEVGAPAVPVLDDIGKSLVLRLVAGTMRKELPVIGGGMRRLGYIDEVKSTISEFMQYGITPEGMAPLIAASEGRRALQRKLLDLQKLYRGFLDYIHDHYTTPEETLGILCGCLPDSRMIRDSVLVFDGFTGFTPIQLTVIQTLLTLVSEVWVSLTIDGASDPYGEPDESLFALTRRTVRQLIRTAWYAAQEDPAEGAAVRALGFDNWEAGRRNADIVLSDPAEGRHRYNAVLRYLEKHLLRYDGANYPDPVEPALSLFEASARRSEVREVCRRIRMLVTSGDAAPCYRDIAVICGDINEYADLFEQEAAACGIPVYIDRTNSIRANPFINAIRGALHVVATDYDYEAVFGLLRGGMLGYAPAQIDELDLYVQALGLRGKKSWSSPFMRIPQAMKNDRTLCMSDEEELAYLGRLNEMRQEISEVLAVLGGDGTQTVLERSRAVYAFILRTGMADRLAEEADRIRQTEAARAREYDQIVARVMALLDQLVDLLGEEALPLKEYMDILDAGFADIEVGTIPQSVDRVTIGDLERTRLGKVRHLFLVGAGDDVIPGGTGTGGVISDMDRQFLTDHVQDVELAPTPAGQMQIQQLYLYMIVSKPQDALTISYVRSSADGRPLRASYLIGNIRAMFPQLALRDPEHQPLEQQLAAAPAAAALLAERLRSYVEGTLPEEDVGTLQVLYGLLGEEGHRLRDAAFMRYRHIPLRTQTAERLYGEELHSSVSRLETFFGCPFAHFARYGLGLRETPRYEMRTSDLGNIYHGTLERFMTALSGRGLNWTELSDAECEAFVHECLASEAGAYGDQILHSSKRMEARLLRIERILGRTVNTLRYQLQQGIFTPAQAELPFVLKPETGLVLHGRIDRLDSARDGETTWLKLMDFKSG
ncbi:MAG: PD-(D/E)XK nuclease family protein, partial [Butyrivibrio sp.]|nr:PD-(D/E)XK nuclease family protein [Butyrivibrio sp.]